MRFAFVISVWGAARGRGGCEARTQVVHHELHRVGRPRLAQRNDQVREFIGDALRFQIRLSSTHLSRLHSLGQPRDTNNLSFHWEFL